MKTIYVILLGLVIFNIMLIFTSSIGVFPNQELYNGTEISSIGNTDLSNMSGMDLLGVAVGGLNPIAGVTAGAIFLAAIAASWAFHSPVPLGIGGFTSVFAGIWIQTVGSLNQFGINNWLLLAGTVGIGILFIINVIEMATGGHNG